MLVVKNISKSFLSHKVLDDVSFELKKGEVITLLGANGVGKTTLMRIISSVIDADKGDVKIFGFDVKKQRESAVANIGYMPENNPIYDDLSVFEFLFFMAKLKKVELSAVYEVIKMLELASVKDQKIITLSKGYKSRVAIAATMLGKPKLLILDEPTEGLDPNQKHSLRKILKEYAKENIVLISTHIIEEAEELNSRVLILKDKKIVVDDNVFDIKAQNKNKNLAEVIRQIMGDL